MFGDLYAIARHTPLHLIITPRGEQLSIIVMPKPTGEAASQQALTKPLSIVGTPADLETEFTAAIGKYTQAVNELRTTLDLPLDALEEAKKKAAKKDAAKAEKETKAAAEAKVRAEASKKAARTRAEKAAEQKKAREAKAAERKRVREAALKKRRDATAARKAKKITLPGATAPAAKVAKGAATKRVGPLPPASAPLPFASSSRHLASKPGKPECIADWRALNDKHGEALTRRIFINKAGTGRRYEKLWKNWEAFIAEAKGFAVAPGDRLTEHGTVVTQPPLKNLDDWPFPVGANVTRPKPRRTIPIAPAAEDEAPAEVVTLKRGEASDGHNHVFYEAGQYLSSITTKPRLEEHIALASQQYLLRVVAIDHRADGGLDFIVVPDPEYTRIHAEQVAQAVRSQAAKNSGAAHTGQSAADVSSSSLSNAAEPAAPEPAAAARYEIRDDATDELICLVDKRPSLGDWVEVPPFVDGKFSRARVIGVEAFGRYFKVTREASTAGAAA